MDLTSHLAQPLKEPKAAVVLLGAAHPLVRASNRLAMLLKQSLVAAALLSASIAALAAGMSGALAYVLAATLVEAALACGAALVSVSKRELVLDLIIAGREDLPLAAVERQRRRLFDPRTRVPLAARYDSIVEETRAPPKVPVLSPALLIDASVVGPLVGELHAIAMQLRTRPESAAGVAAAERLLRDGGSALYRDDPAALREELARVRHLLRSPTGR